MLRKAIAVLLVVMLVTVAQAQDEPQVGGEMVIGSLFVTADIDVHTSVFEGFSRFLNASLIAVDPETGDLVPYIATSWSSNEEGTTWTFELRDDVMFHNGDPLTAQDFVYTYEWVNNPDNGSVFARTQWENVASVTATDTYMLEITFVQPGSSALLGLTTPGTAPLSQNAVEAAGEDYPLNPVGAGPFRLVEFEPQQRIVMERNPDFTWGPSYTHGGPPFLEQVVIRNLQDFNIVRDGLLSNELDAGVIVPSDVHVFENNADFSVNSIVSAYSYPVILFNNQQPPVDDTLLRRALNHAVDREVFLSIVGQGRGEATAVPVSSNMIGYTEEAQALGYSYDPDMAISLLNEAGYTDSDGDNILDRDGEPLELDLFVTPEFVTVRTAELFQAQLAEIGVDVVIQQLEFAAFDEAVFFNQNYTMAVGSVFVDRPHVGRLIDALGSEGFFNSSAYNNPGADAALAQLAAATTPEDTETALLEALNIVMADAPVIPLFNLAETIIVSDRVGDVIVHPYQNAFRNIELYDAFIAN